METTDYCSYQLSKQLKACGFDEPCGKSIKIIPGTEREEWDEEECQWCTVQDIEYYPKITLWHAQKWLREKKELYVNCFWNAKGQHWQPHCQWMNEVQGEPIGYAESYEGGLSMAIAAVLELIKKGE